jgi:hypothetical protein
LTLPLAETRNIDTPKSLITFCSYIGFFAFSGFQTLQFRESFCRGS